MALAIGAGTANAAVDPAITGSGSTLISPLVTEWNTRLGGGITYGGGGSGKGITDISNGTVDFGASDAPLTNDQASKCAGCVMFPVSLSAIGITYNLPGVSNLKLTADVVAAIYKGQITTWNDAKIAKLNKGASLPATKITPVHRTDGSGSTYAFTRWLSSAVKSWRSSPGFGTLLSWPPVGTAGSGSGGIANAVKGTTGAIGYVGVDYMIPNKLPAAMVGNAAGKFVYPNLRNLSAAASTIKKMPKNNAVIIVNPPKTNTKAYPIGTFTYVIAKKGSPKAAGLKQFISYAVGAGRGLRADIGFAPLPKVVYKATQKAVKSL
jgi:phosphate transport system substrate-binding protein